MARSPKSAQATQATPDKIPLTKTQAHRLAGLTGIELKEIEGQTIAQLSESLKWRIDPNLLLFRRVCGQVVRWDPISGQYQPVPFAVVHVMDTDCDFLGFFPYQAKWAWLYPLFCREEQIAEVVTDACGRFCVWVPWFDIEWVIRWRLERVCFPEIFVPPTLGDLLEVFGVQPPSAPNNTPIQLGDGGITLSRLANVIGKENASRLLLLEQAPAFGGGQAAMTTLLGQPAFRDIVPPPFSSKLSELQARDGGLRNIVRGKAEREYRLDPNRYVGPFPLWKCQWELKEELVPILEAPDITFWVTQDVDGDGDQETIYTDGWFGVGWKSGPLSDVILHASPIARINGSCESPPVGDCEVPEILFAGLMPVSGAYIDTTAGPNRGFGVRPNPPHADGIIRPSVFPPAPSPDTPSNAPFTGTVQIYGCNQYPKGEYYRLLYSFNGAASVPFTSLSWYIDPFPGPGPALLVTPDAQGWYPILAAPDSWMPPNELLDWPTTSFPDGLYDVTMEIGNASKAVIFTTPAKTPFYVDNSAPRPQFLSLAWRVLPSGAWNVFPTLVCPVVERPSGSDIEFQVQYQVSAAHLLKYTLATSGCGGGVMQPDPEPNALPYAYWHKNAADNFATQAATFVLPGSASAGCYGFVLNAYSRAFNPAGGDPSNPQAHDWYYDATWLNWSQADLSVAVFDV